MFPERRYMMTVKVGEVQVKMSGDVKKTDNVGIELRVSWLPKAEFVKFKLSEDLKTGDVVKVTLEKI